MKKITRTVTQKTVEIVCYNPIIKSLETHICELYEDDTPAKYAKRHGLKMVDYQNKGTKTLKFALDLEDFLNMASICDSAETEEEDSTENEEEEGVLE